METGFEEFTRQQWSALGPHRHSPLSAAQTASLMATGEPLSPEEVVDVYLPLAHFLRLIADTKVDANHRISAFLDEGNRTGPFIIGIAGSVAVGKSTTARVLQALLRQGIGRPTVDLLTTDGFLFPNAILESRNLMDRKGFPESYDQRLLLDVLSAIRRGDPEVATPIYSHLMYDIVPDRFEFFRRPDIVIVEGLNVLQINTSGGASTQVVSDFFDFSIYVDASEVDIAQWFEDRLLALRSTVLQDEDSYFHRFASIPEGEVKVIARQIWSDINLVNLHENIAPTRSRAHLVLEKDRQHRVQKLYLRHP